VSFSDHLLSGVHLSVCLTVCPSVNFHIFDFFSRTTAPILTRLGTNHSWREKIQVCSKEGDSPSPRGDNSERVKIHWNFLKIFFFRTCRPNSIKLSANYPCVKGIQVCSKGPGPLQRGDNHKNVKMGWGHLKIFFSRTTGPILTRLVTNHPWVKGIQVCSKERNSPSPKGDNGERVKIHWKIWKIFFRTSRPNSIKLGVNYLWLKGIQVYSNKGQVLFKGEMITKM
jgi:hypothetical protein